MKKSVQAVVKKSVQTGMKKPVQKSGYKNAAYLIAGFCGAALVLVITSRYGAGLSHDSAAYVYAANSFLEGKGFVYFGYGTPFIQWPPLYPILLALIGHLGFDIVSIARVFNALLFGLIVFMTGRWLGRNVRFLPFVIAGTSAVILSAALQQASVFIWSEPLFIVFVILFLNGIERFLNKQSDRILVAFSLFAALACLTRYAGVSLVLAGTVILLLQNKKFINKLYDIIKFVLISVLPIGIWIVRNFVISGTLFGYRTVSTSGIKKNIGLTGETVLLWIFPFLRTDKFHFLKMTFFAGSLLILTGIAFILIFNKINKWKRINLLDWIMKNHNKIIPALVFLLVYCIYIVLSAIKYSMDPIGNRLLSPAAVPLAVLIIIFIDSIPFVLYRYFNSRKLNFLLMAFLCIWLVYPVAETYFYTVRSFKGETGVYASQQWRESKLIYYIKDNFTIKNENHIIYSNYPDALYMLTGIKAQYTPKRIGPREYSLQSLIEKLKPVPGIKKGNSTEPASELIAWFDKDSGNQVYSADELRRYFVIETVYKAADGILYSIRSK